MWRIVPVFLLVPIGSLPLRFVFGVLAALLLSPLGAQDMPAGLVRELVVGFCLGAAASVPLYAARLSGAISGAMLDGQFDTHESGQSLESLATALGLAIFVFLSGPEQVLAALAKSYQILPLSERGIPGDPASHTSRWGVLLLPGQVVALGLWLSAPVVLSMVLVRVIFAFSARLGALVSAQGSAVLGLALVAVVGWSFVQLPSGLYALVGMVGEFLAEALRGL